MTVIILEIHPNMIKFKKVQDFFSDQTPIALPFCHQHDDRFHAKKIHFVSYARYSLGTFQVTNLVLHTYKIYLICGGLWEHGKHK